MKTFRVIFGLLIIFQLGILGKLWLTGGDFGAHANFVGLFYKTMGFVLFFEILLPKARLPAKTRSALFAVAVLSYGAEMMVENANFYATTEWADIIAHFSAAALLACMGYLLITGAPQFSKIVHKRYTVLTTLCLIMVLHEIYEYTSDHLFGTFSIGFGDPRYDTMEDLLFGLSGTVFGIWVGTIIKKYIK